MPLIKGQKINQRARVDGKGRPCDACGARHAPQNCLYVPEVRTGWCGWCGDDVPGKLAFCGAQCSHEYAMDVIENSRPVRNSEQASGARLTVAAE